MEGADEPTSGPEYYLRRRAQWLSATASSTLPDSATKPSSASLDRLESSLSQPQAEEDDELWDEYLSTVYDRLVGGTRLKNPVALKWAVSRSHCAFSLSSFAHIDQ